MKAYVYFLLNDEQLDWIRRKWLDFRGGHTTYLAFVITFANFITIQYALVINNIEWLKGVFSSIWMFIVVFTLVYIPVAIAIGYWHRKSQWRVEQEALFAENKANARMWLFMLELIEGNASEDEKREMRNYLRKILRQSQGLQIPGSKPESSTSNGDIQNKSKS